MQMAAEGPMSRREALATGTGMAALVAAPFSASAGWLSGPGAEVLEPNSAAVDKEVLGSAAVQKSLRNTLGYLKAVKQIEAEMNKDPQADVRTFVKVFAFDKIRTDLNTVNTALDEDTQRGTDRLIRATIQDITEIETSGILKPGIPRSERKIGIIKAKLAKLDAAFTDFLKFFV